MQPPIAPRHPVSRTLHGVETTDDYAWLSDRSDPEAMAYLQAENAYTEQATRHLTGLRRQVFEEIRSRIQETDLSVPARRGNWWYVTHTREGLQYPIHARRHRGPEGPEQIMLDVNALAEGHEFLATGVVSVSNDHRLLAYSTDTTGSERFTLRFRDLASSSDLGDVIDDTYYSLAWSADDRHVFYITTDEAHRPYRVWRHTLGTDPAGDVVVFEESDERFYVSVGSTQDRRYVLIASASQTTSEILAMPTADVDARPEPVVPRVQGVEYDVDHRDGRWMIVTNDAAINGRLFSCSVDDPGDVDELIAHDPDAKLSGVVALRDHVVVTGRHAGLRSITIVDRGGTPRRLSFDEEVYRVGLERNLEYDTSALRIAYQSLVTPPQVIDVDLVTDERTLLKETPVLGGYDRTAYRQQRMWATAPDGAQIPISLVYRLDTTAPPAPLLLYGYGSYEITIDPGFSPARLSLLDRGVAFAIAHIRGGGAMGKLWYENGKMSSKSRTFSDFVAAAEHLVDNGWTDPDLLAARGGSAGGLLMGAVANLRPDLFRSIVAEVPFVDVINTMLDETLPLTVVEWEEWGNPAIAEHYQWMAAYAPYENVRRAEYPAMLVTAGLNDPRVSYWEPAKWVAKLRTVWHTERSLLLKTEMGAGHMGPSGRYDAWRDEAFVVAWLLDQWGLAGASEG